MDVAEILTVFGVALLAVFQAVVWWAGVRTARATEDMADTLRDVLVELRRGVR